MSANADLASLITDAEFQKLSTLIYDRFGIALSDKKRSLLVGRLQKHLRELRLPDFNAYIDYVSRDTKGAAINDLINSISTNHTYFWREPAHFEFMLKTVLPETIARLRAARELDIRVWCAGCSSGEESFLLNILLHEALGPEYSRWKAGLLATDISQRVLDIAAAGHYEDDRLQHLPEALKKKYFKRASSGWDVQDFVKRDIVYRRFNLMNEQFPFRRPFHIIFCRNVMIYFDTPTREALVRRFFASTAENGYFFIGHSETLSRATTPYSYVMPACYKKEATR
jgi:chemotaxis protein methyltransferase CheR